MSDDVKVDEMATQLCDAYARTILTAVAGLPAHQALQLAATLLTVQQDVLAGLRVSYKAKPAVDGAAITEDWRRGLTVQEIMRDRGVSRPTAYKYHPNKGQRRTG